MDPNGENEPSDAIIENIVDLFNYKVVELNNDAGELILI